MRGIFDARDDTTVTRQMYFHWDYLNERVKQSFPRAADRAKSFSWSASRTVSGRPR